MLFFNTNRVTMSAENQQETWARANFEKVYLGDIRRTKRLVELAEAMATQPGSSLAKLGTTWYDIKSYYNLLRHKHMSPDIIQANHRHCVVEQIESAENDVLLIEDGSELSWSGKKPIKGLGPVGSGNAWDQGFILQSALAVEMIPVKKSENRTQNTARVPVKILGLADQQYHIRPPKREKIIRRRDSNEPLETDLWRNTIDRIPDLSTKQKRIIRVCDRAADIYEVIRETEEKGYDYVIRAKHNRTIEGVTDDDGNPIHLFQHPELENSKSTCELYLRGRKEKEARIAKLNLSYVQTSTLAPKRRGASHGKLPSLEYTIVRVWEDSPLSESNDERIEWYLLTSIPVENNEDLFRIVEIYCIRWTIEDYHKALKTGLNAEKLQLESADGLMAAIAIMSVVALRLVDLRERVRMVPDAPAEESGLSQLELKVLSKYLKKEVKTVRCVGLAIGRLGGHLNRKADGMPGIITLWRGMSQLIQLVKGAQLALELNSS